jgi:Mn2+/Fe2+ NRAMP family transporter
MITDPYSRDAGSIREPPREFVATLRCLGPGMILAGSIVGSGELIVTTKLGAEAGFTFLWFVLLSCAIKVVVQTEIARHTISSGETFLRVFNELPGPSMQRPRWLTLTWMTMVVGACVVGVATYVALEESRQNWPAAVAIGVAVVVVSAGGGWTVSRFAHKGRQTRINWFSWIWLASLLLVFVNSGAILGGAGQTLQMAMPDVFGIGGARIWAILVAAGSALLLLGGRYESLEKMLIVLVSSFTLVTVVGTLMLQGTSYAITISDLRLGLSFSFPDPLSGAVTLTALAMYAGTGVAFGEMWNYTYWCVEKGYARYAGAPELDADWPRRARGWVRVMYIDALLTMVIYTVNTICFYFLGAAILNAKGLNPTGRETLEVLSAIFTESLGQWAAALFIVGAFCVLLTTVLSGVAGSSRLMADAMAVIGLIDAKDFKQRLRFIRVFIVASLTLFAIAFWLFEDPPAMLLVTSSLMAALMYPILGIGVLYLRHCKIDARIAPGLVTTGWLWVCAVALTVISPGGILLALLLSR